MSIESPFTYGEAYWKLQVDALLSEKESLEKELVPMLGPLLAAIKSSGRLPSSVLQFISNIETPKAPAGSNVLTGLGGQAASTIADTFLGSALQDYKYSLNEQFTDLRIDGQVVSILKQRRLATDELFDARMKSQGFKPQEGRAYYDALFPYPDITDIMTYARYVSEPENPKEYVWKMFDVPERDYNIWYWMSQLHPTTADITTLRKWGFLDDYNASRELAKIGWNDRDRLMQIDLSYSLPNPMLMVQGGLITDIKDDQLLADISKSDIHPDYAQRYLDAVLSKPSTQDIIDYTLRHDPELEKLSEDLRRIGVHPNYFEIYKELAYYIPPVNDLITMAVREVFTPTIAARFGQYEDFPAEFKTYAGKKGVSEEWAKRYWAAHWNLPSPQQGFEMLHRRVISEGDLELLLRAQDVMPFWRDKLKKIAYRVLTRVDVRRMYALGVLNEIEVEQAYGDMGYNSVDAKRMKDFTVRYVGRTTGKLTLNDIMTTYSKGLLSDGEAKQLMMELGISSDEALDTIEAAAHKREWRLTEQKIKTVESEYKTGKINSQEAQGALRSINVGSIEIKVFIDRWTADMTTELDSLWTVSQTLSFLKDGLIDSSRATQELRLHGFSQDRIQVYLQSVSRSLRS